MPDPDSSPTADDLLRHAGWLRRLAKRLVGDGNADDTVQEVWLAALRHRPGRGGGLASWLRRVTRNRAVGERRARSRRAAREAALVASTPSPATVDLVTRAEGTRRLVHAVLRLDPKQRDAILLRYFEELSPAEIARRLDVPSGTVRSHLTRGLQNLRQALDNESNGDRSRWMLALAPLTTLATANTLALIMTTTQKIWASLCFALVLLSLIVLPTLLRSPEPPDVSQQVIAAAAKAEDQTSVGAIDGVAPPNRTVFFAQPEATPVATVVVRVVHGVTGEAVPNATVRFLTAQSEWHKLTWPERSELAWNREQLLRRVGAQTMTDSDGIASVPKRSFATMVTARKGALFGTGNRAAKANEIVVTVLPERLLAVEVRYQDGTPAPGAQVNYRLRSRSQPANGHTGRNALLKNEVALRAPDQVLGITDKNGRARLHLEGIEEPSMTLYVCMTGYKHAEQTVDIETLDDQPVRITLPSCGSFTVRLLDTHGRLLPPHALPEPYASVVTFELEGANSGFKFDSTLGQRCLVDAQGTVRFQNVPLDRFVMLSIHGIRDPISFRGPTAESPHAVVEHRMGKGLASLHGTFVASNGKPLREATVHVTYLLATGVIRTQIRTNQEGAFCAFAPVATAGQRVRVCVAWNRLAAEIPLHRAITGDTPVATIRLQPAPLLIAGRVERADGEPVERASIAIEYRLPGATWARAKHLHPISMGDGRFEYYGLVPDAELRLAVFTGEFAPIAPIPFARGTRNASIVLRR